MTPGGYDGVRAEVDGSTGIARLVLDRPERRNALDSSLVAELSRALTDLEVDERARVVALTGAGPDFCAGADLREVAASMDGDVMAGLAEADALGELFVLLRRLVKPVVAVVRGRALAGGCGLAMACDMVLAADTATFGCPEVRLGFVPAMVMAILRRSLGEKRAFELVSLGEAVSAARARELGIVNRVVPEAELEERAAELLGELAARSASALALTKRLLYGADGLAFEEAIRNGAEVNALARRTEDCREGVRRFLER